MNTTVNGSNCSISVNPTADKIVKTFTYCLIFIVSLVGNSLIAIIVYRTQTLRKPVNLFMVNMAMSDLLFPIFMFPWNLTELYLGLQDSWPISGNLGQILCKFLIFLPSVSVAVSVQSLILIAVDRFGAVVFPFRPPLIRSKLCRFFILATWVMAVVLCSPYLFALKVVEHEGRFVCVERWKETFGEASSISIYALLLSVFLFYIPIAVLTILYSIILIKLKTRIFPGEQSAHVAEQRAKRHRNVLKMVIAIVLAFALCWLPFTIIGSQGLPCKIFFDMAWLVAQSNCALNPCICFFFSENYRRGVKAFLKCFGASRCGKE